MGNKGFVYIITNDIFKDNCVKIGKTSKTPEERCLELYTGKSGVPIPFNVYAAIESEHYNEIERALHEYFADKRINQNREWFNLSPEDVLRTFNLLISSVHAGTLIRYDETETEDENTETVDNTKPINTKYVDFWLKFIKYNTSKGGVFASKTPSKRNYLATKIKDSTSSYIGCAIVNDQLKVEVVSFSKDKSDYNYFESYKEQIEKEFGKPLVWTRLNDCRHSRIYYTIDRDNKTDDEVFDFFTNESNKLLHVIEPYAIKYKQMNG